MPLPKAFAAAISRHQPHSDGLVKLFDTARGSSAFVIGVTGHRDLHPEGEAQLRRQIDEFLADLRRRLPDTPIRVLVGMAQGADLLVAQAAIHAGMQVEALLPMPLHRYLDDFNAESAAAMQKLLADTRVKCTLLSEDEPAPHGDAARNALYAKLMDALIDRCNLVLALWSGGPARFPGGTADTVLRYLGSHNPDTQHAPRIEDRTNDVLATFGPNFVYWIPTRRSDAVAPPAQGPAYLYGLSESLLASHHGMPEPLSVQLEELNSYNREFARLRVAQSIGKLDSLMPALDDKDTDRAALERLDFEYGKADALAIYYQRHSDRLFRWFSYTASAMALLFLVYAKLHGGDVLLLVYVSMLVLSVVVFYFVRHRHWFLKHLVYRSLAETIRTRFFLRAARADRFIDAAELLHLTGIHQFAGFSWIANLLRSTQPSRPEDALAPASKPDRLDNVRQHWILGQQRYFERRVRTLERTSHRLERLKSAMIVAIALLALSLLVFSHAMHEQVAGGIYMKDIVIFFMGLLPVWLGIWEIYQNKMATRELLWQYRNQLTHFTHAELHLSRTTAADRQRQILAQVGRKSLMESYLWTIHRYHREYEPPSVG